MSTATNVIRASLEMSAFVVNAYLEDLTDEELFIRPAENANHIAWQLGHLITAENGMVNQICPGNMPDLPEGFAQGAGCLHLHNSAPCRRGPQAFGSSSEIDQLLHDRQRSRANRDHDESDRLRTLCRQATAASC